MLHCSHGFGAAPRRRSLRAALTVCGSVLAVALPGCHHRPRYPHEAASPQAVLERQLINSQHRGNKRTGDGGMLYTTDFTAASSESLRVPYDLLKLECENHGGSFEPSEPPPTPAAAVAAKADQGRTPGIPEGIHAALRDADARQLFGRHVCIAGVYLWHADLEPVQLSPTRNPNTYRFQLYVKAVSAPDYDPEAPAGPGLPATGHAAGWPQPSAAGEPGAAPGPGPSAAPGARPVSPLDPRPSQPAPVGDQLLADPHPFGVSPGVDSPEALVQKLGLSLDTATHCDAANLIGLCWQNPGGSEASSLRATFAELGSNPVLAELEIHYPASSFTWLAGMLSNLLGPSDGATAAGSLQWSWLHTTVELAQVGQNDVRVCVAHKPSLDRARLPSGSPARVAKSVPPAAPFQLQLGYEPAQVAQSKLQAAGFSVTPNGCVDGGPTTRPVFTRTCSLQVKQVPGVTGAWVRNVDIGDGRPRLAELGYQLDRAKLKDMERELTAQYGEPIPSTGDALQWWTGPVGITLTRGSGKDAPTLRYYHGRLLQFFIVAEARRAAPPQARPNQAL